MQGSRRTPAAAAVHDAVIIAVGAKRSRKSPYPGSDADGVFGGVEFLRDVALGEAPPLGRRVVVVGGGDAAMDSARTALRVSGQEEDDAASASHEEVDQISIEFKRLTALPTAATGST